MTTRLACGCLLLGAVPVLSCWVVSVPTWAASRGERAKIVIDGSCPYRTGMEPLQEHANDVQPVAQKCYLLSHLAEFANNSGCDPIDDEGKKSRATKAADDISRYYY